MLQNLKARFCRLAGVDKIRSTFYQSRTNGAVERLNGSIQTMLAKRVKETQTDWHLHLPIVISAYRATVHEVTNFSPNMLMFGREVRLPVDLLYECPANNRAMPRSTDEFVQGLADRMLDNFEAARDNLHRAAEIRKSQYDTKVKSVPFSVGDRVYYWYPRKFAGRSPKLQSLYTGPYTIVRVVDSHNLVIRKSPRSKPMVVHRDKLKRIISFIDGESPADRAGGNSTMSDSVERTPPSGDMESSGGAT